MREHLFPPPAPRFLDNTGRKTARKPAVPVGKRKSFKKGQITIQFRHDHHFRSSRAEALRLKVQWKEVIAPDAPPLLEPKDPDMENDWRDVPPKHLTRHPRFALYL